MDIAQTRLIAGCVSYALATIFLSMGIFAAVSTWRTGRFSSGVPIVPAIFATFGGLFTGFWKATIVIVLLDLGSLFLPKKGVRSKQSLPTKKHD